MKKQRLVRCLGILLVALGVASAAFAQGVDAVIDKHLAAVGGRAALGKLTSRKSTGTITLTTPGGDVSGTIETVAKAPNKVRALMTIDLSSVGAGSMIVEQRFDGSSGMTMNSMQGDTEITGKQLENFRNNIFPTPLLTYKDRGTKVEQAGTEKIQGKDAIVLVITPTAGSPVRLFLDPDTYLVMRSVTTVNAPQLGGDAQQTSEFSDYRTVDGVKVPFRIVTSNPLQTITIALTKVEHNGAIDDALFGPKK
jgi:outer membrane lipoprotein-sorting protein